VLGTRDFYLFRTADGILYNAIRYTYTFLIGSLGPVVTTLLGMLGNITTLIFGRLFLGEKNSAKEWGINILLCVLVGLGFYLK
jgi:drug/metabolite transporter (DMT)-like permease